MLTLILSFFVRRAGTLLQFTGLLELARGEEVHEIEDPEAIGVDVHTQLTEAFMRKYGGEEEAAEVPLA